MPKPKRWMVQLAATIASNPHLGGFVTATLYRGNAKYLCVPGLNCYSCPAAIGACPIGALQATIGSSKFSFAAYATGILVFLGVLLGRVVCGFLCPFGWMQELVHRLPTKKFGTRSLRVLTKLKYVILALFVIALPATVVNEVGMGDPWFCKWLCPAGILEGALPLALASEGIRHALGSLFTWKLCLLLGLVVLAMFFYRPFCKWLCPLGAIYGAFNRISIYRLEVDRHACTSCGACARICKMDVAMPEKPNATECIRCGDCVRACPHHAISAGFKLPRNEGHTGTGAPETIGGTPEKTGGTLAAPASTPPGATHQPANRGPNTTRADTRPPCSGHTERSPL